MGMTMTEKILAQHAGRDAVQAGDLLVAQVDLVLANDITGPPAIAEFEKIGRPVFDKDKIALVPDHFSPCKDIKSATMCKRMRDFARQHEITNYFEVGRMGIEHALLPDSGLVAPGEIIIGADSHTCTYGALNALSTGMGQTDIGAAMASGTTWFKVPATIKVELTGKLPKYVKGKDIILTLIGMIGVDGARYQSLEFCGDGVAELEMSDRFTICNMAIEAGGKNGIFPVDEKTIEYMKEHSKRPFVEYSADDDAEYEQVYDINLAEIKPTVAFPHLPENKPTYLMGVGTPANILEAVDRGADFFDCVYPSRNGRHGHVYTNHGKMNLFNAKYELDDRPIEEGCGCPACRSYSRAYIRHLLKAKEMLGMRLCVLHNLYFYNTMMEEIREAIEAGEYKAYKKRKLEGMMQ